jgi:hypothetical protein
MYSIGKPEQSNALRVSLAIIVCSAVGFVVPSTSRSTTTSPSAHLARTQSVTDTANLRYVRESGSDLLEEGQASGGLSGRVKVRLNVGATIYGTFTIYASHGSISGKGSGQLHGTGTYASFGGSMRVTRGTGRYAHARGHGGFYGVMNRNKCKDPQRQGCPLTVQTTGTLVY